MERLTRRIQDRFWTAKACRVFSNELERACPPTRREQAKRYERLKQIREYAKSHGWSVVVRDAGLEATFRSAAEN